MKYDSYEYRNKSSRRGAQLIPTGMLIVEKKLRQKKYTTQKTKKMHNTKNHG